MAFDETSDGANYLSGLKQSESSPPVAGVAPARGFEVPDSGDARIGDSIPSGKASAPAAEGRRSPRYRCKGSVRLQENVSTVTTWATFADISMHGCYVESTTPLSVSTALSLQLSVNGFRVEATGEVRVVYPGLGMGVSFSQISEEDRGRLRELVRSISPASVIVSPRTASQPPSIAQSGALPGMANPAAALEAMLNFFEDRHIMGREEFLKILRKSR
jgi:hypothetical protein